MPCAAQPIKLLTCLLARGAVAASELLAGLLWLLDSAHVAQTRYKSWVGLGRLLLGRCLRFAFRFGLGLRFWFLLSLAKWPKIGWRHACRHSPSLRARVQEVPLLLELVEDLCVLLVVAWDFCGLLATAAQAEGKPLEQQFYLSVVSY